MGFVEAMESIRRERDHLNELLEQMEAQRARFVGSAPPPSQPAAKAEAATTTVLIPEPTPAPRPAATAKGRQGRPWDQVDPDWSWRKQLLQPVLRHKKATRARGDALDVLLDATHTVPGGQKVKLGKSTLYLWMKEIEAESDGAAAAVTPAAAPKEQASQVPLRYARPESREWRRQLLADVLALPDGNAREDALRALKGQRVFLVDGTIRRITAVELREWVAEAERGDVSPERERLQASGSIGNPLQISKGYDTPDRRNIACSAYAACLGYVARRGWKGWACDGCTGPGKQTSLNLGGKSGARPQQRSTSRLRVFQ